MVAVMSADHLNVIESQAALYLFSCSVFLSAARQQGKGQRAGSE